MPSLLSVLLLTVASATAIALPRSNIEKRASNFQLYAYGGSSDDTAIGGLPVIYADGLAYCGNTTPPGASNMSHITMNMTNSQLEVTNMNNTKYYIHNNDTGLMQTGFTQAANSTTITSGFHFYGDYVMWEDDAGAYQTLFFAVPTTDTGVYKLSWGSGGENDSTAVPVSIRRLAPT